MSKSDSIFSLRTRKVSLANPKFKALLTLKKDFSVKNFPKNLFDNEMQQFADHYHHSNLEYPDIDNDDDILSEMSYFPMYKDPELC